MTLVLCSVGLSRPLSRPLISQTTRAWKTCLRCCRTRSVSHSQRCFARPPPKEEGGKNPPKAAEVPTSKQPPMLPTSSRCIFEFISRTFEAPPPCISRWALVLWTSGFVVWAFILTFHTVGKDQREITRYCRAGAPGRTYRKGERGVLRKPVIWQLFKSYTTCYDLFGNGCHTSGFICTCTRTWKPWPSTEQLCSLDYV